MPSQRFPTRFSLRTLLIATAVFALVLMFYTVWRNFSAPAVRWEGVASLQEVLASDKRAVKIVLVWANWMPQTSHRYADALVSGVPFRQYVRRRQVQTYRKCSGRRYKVREPQNGND